MCVCVCVCVCPGKVVKSDIISDLIICIMDLFYSVCLFITTVVNLKAFRVGLMFFLHVAFKLMSL